MIDEIYVFIGTMVRCIFNSDNYKIYAMDVDKKVYPHIKHNKFKNVTISGSNLFELVPGVNYTITGIEKQNEKYGIQYEVKNIEGSAPLSLEDQQKFLETILTERESSALLDVYPDIVDRIMNDRLDDVDLKKVKGIKKKTFQKIIEKVQTNFKLGNMCKIFYNLMDLKTIQKLYNFFGSSDKVIEVLRKNPYSALTSIDRIGFKTADAMLLALQDKIIQETEDGKIVTFSFDENIKYSKDRCLACMQYYLNDMEDNSGDTYMTIEDLKTKVKAYVPETMQYFDELLKDDKKFYVDYVESQVANKETYQCEKYIADKFKQGMTDVSHWDFDLTPFAEVDGYKLTEKQRSIQGMICDNGISVLIGYSGSGKSTSVNAIIQMCQANNISYILGSPTAKAAKVLSEACSSLDNGTITATTIHRLLKYLPGYGFMYNKTNPLPYQLVIIDESSMLDIWLTKSLLEAIDFNKTRLLLVGDYAQIASVGCGNVLYDVCQSDVPVVFLDQIFRYGEDGLTTVCTRVRKRQSFLPALDERPICKIGQSYIFEKVADEKIVDKCVSYYKALLTNHSVSDLLVLSAYNKGPYGTIVLNNAIQQAINPNPDGVVIQRGNTTVAFKKNDIVAQCVNNYHSIICDETGEKYEVDGVNAETLIANGESGRILEVNEKYMVIQFEKNCIYKERSSYDELRLGYVTSFHSSQGSQAKITVVLTPTSHAFFLNSNLLYVAISRSKELCIHLGNERTVNICAHKKMELTRKTLLTKLIKNT